MSSPRPNSLASLKASVTRGFHFAATLDTSSLACISRASSCRVPFRVRRAVPPIAPSQLWSTAVEVRHGGEA